MEMDIKELKQTSIAALGVCSGVYFLWDKEELVYVGQGWNCFLRVAEHTRKEKHNRVTFTSWDFIPVDDKRERKALERELIAQFKPTHNRTRR